MRFSAFFWRLATLLRLPAPKRLDFERMARIQLRRAEAEAVQQTTGGQGREPARV